MYKNCSIETLKANHYVFSLNIKPKGRINIFFIV